MTEPFSDLTRQQKVIEILRWLAVLPAAVLGGLAAHVLSLVLNSPGCTRGMVNPAESVVDHFFVVFVANIAFGAGAVIAGAKTAPRYQLQASALLAALFIFYSGMVLAIFIQRPSTPWDIMAIIVGAVGAAGGVAYIYSSEET